MAKKSIIKLNEQYFSCNPINENFVDVPASNTESESEAPTIAIARVISQNADDDICKTNPDDWSDETKLKCADKNKDKDKDGDSDGDGKEDSKKKKYRTKVRSKKRTLKGSKKGSRKGSRKGGSRKGGSKKGGSKKGGSKKRSKKSKEGFCAGNTCLTEDNLKSLIKLLKKLELKK